MLLQFCKNLLLRIQLTYNTFNNANRWPFLLLPGVGVPRRGEVVGELIYLATRARIYNNVPPSSSFHSPFQTYVLQHPYQSAIYEIVSKKFRKKDRYVWSEWIYRLLLHPLTKRRSALKLTFWQKRRRNSNVFLSFSLYSVQEYSVLKEKRKKTSGNIWKICLKVLTFAPAFREEADAESASLIEAALRTSSSSFISLSQRETTRKRKKKKTFEIIWKIYLKVLTFASAFWKEKQF